MRSTYLYLRAVQRVAILEHFVEQDQLYLGLVLGPGPGGGAKPGALPQEYGDHSHTA